MAIDDDMARFAHRDGRLALHRASPLTWPAIIGLLAAGLLGCGTGSVARQGDTRSGPTASRSATEVPSLRAYWTLHRLSAASPLGARQTSRRLKVLQQALRVGALFSTEGKTDHFCTASSVSGGRGNVIITAAHCVYDPHGSGLRRNIVFVPAYRRGHAPFGVWVPKSFIVDDRWKTSADPDLDVAFVVLQPQAGKNITDVSGSNPIRFEPGYSQVVRVTGYPQSADAPVTCVNATSEQSPTQLRFACQGFPGGTSGSPWVVRPNNTSHTATIVGVIGGYQEGGDTPDISYSPYFGSDIQRLYEQALAAS